VSRRFRIRWASAVCLFSIAIPPVLSERVRFIADSPTPYSGHRTLRIANSAVDYRDHVGVATAANDGLTPESSIDQNDRNDRSHRRKPVSESVAAADVLQVGRSSGYLKEQVRFSHIESGVRRQEFRRPQDSAFLNVHGGVFLR
jgi:hypothetical protein